MPEQGLDRERVLICLGGSFQGPQLSQQVSHCSGTRAGLQPLLAALWPRPPVGSWREGEGVGGGSPLKVPTPVLSTGLPQLPPGPLRWQEMDRDRDRERQRKEDRKKEAKMYRNQLVCDREREASRQLRPGCSDKQGPGGLVSEVTPDWPLPEGGSRVCQGATRTPAPLHLQPVV